MVGGLALGMVLLMACDNYRDKADLQQRAWMEQRRAAPTETTEQLEVKALCQAMPYRCPKGAAATTIEDIRALDKQAMTPLTPGQVAEEAAKYQKRLREKYEEEQALTLRRIQEESRREDRRIKYEAERKAARLHDLCEADVRMARMAVDFRDSKRPLVDTLKFQRSLGASSRALLLTQRIYSHGITERQAAEMAEAACLISEP